MTRARKKASVGFGALRVEGGLIAPAKLDEIANLEAGEQSPADYGIPKGLAIKDEIARYFRIGQALHKDFAGASKPSLTATTRFVEALLHQAFGFDDIGPAGVRTLDDRSFPIALESRSGRAPAVVTTPDETLDQASAKLSAEGRKRSAATLMQDWLNAHDGALWGVACNGAALRVLRDNASLTRPAYIEADLRQMFEAEDFASFSILWLLIHATRFGGVDASVADCALERWREAGAKAGVAARDRLRDGVERALVTLGNGFLASAAVREKLESGALTLDAYFNELLRLVYRLIFLFAAEDRDVLHPPGADQSARRLYAQGYSMGRLRERAVRRNAWDKHGDQWDGMKIVFRALTRGEKRLALPALGGLFLPSQTPTLDGATLSNKALLETIFRLAWLRDDKALVPVNWRDMETEELGSVYESLLELTPQFKDNGREFGFAEGAETRGNARKTSGSYYTPDSLVQALLDTALDPVLDRVEAEADDPAEALLDVTVMDPACGSGHFLLAAARRIATRVARARAGGLASAADYAHALRDVARSCIHGVDRNPMAVELTKVALWIETVEPGKPLGFLDANIRCGDALFGVYDLEALRQGIPDAAYKPSTGDDKETSRHYAKLNKAEREGQGALDYDGGKSELPPPPPLAKAAHAVRDLPEDTVEEIAAKQARWDQVQHDPRLWNWHVAADLYCAAFLTPKTGGPPANRRTAMVPLTGDVWAKLHGRQPWTLMEREAIERAEGARAFHWPLEFPDVLGNGRGGFDVVIGNPPWERIKLQEEEFFAARSPEIVEAKNAAARKKLIHALPQTNPKLAAEWEAAQRQADVESTFMRHSGRFPLGGVGDVNTYAVFTDLFRQAISPLGAAGLLVPNGLVTGFTYRAFLRHLLETATLVSFFGFENEDKIFPDVHNETKFGILTISGSNRPVDRPWFTAHLRQPNEIHDRERRYSLTAQEIEAISPNTLNLPAFRWAKDAEAAAAIYKGAPVLIRRWADGRIENPWQVRLKSLLHMANDSIHFLDHAEIAPLIVGRRNAAASLSDGRKVYPLYEGKMFWHFDHRYGTYERQSEKQANKGVLPRVPDSSHDDPSYQVEPRYWIDANLTREVLVGLPDKEWFFAWRDVGPTERTFVGTVIPMTATGHKAPVMSSERKPTQFSALCGMLSSLVVDYCARQKSNSMTFFVVEQIPVPPPEALEDDLAWLGRSPQDWLSDRVLELCYTNSEVAPFASDLGRRHPPFRWQPERRVLLQAEIDAATMHLYGLSRTHAEWLLDSFTVLRKYEERDHNEYRTKRLVLEIYDDMAAARQTGHAYQTRLNPVPADPRCCHPVSTPHSIDHAELFRSWNFADGAWATPTTGNVLDHTLVQVAAVLKALPGATPINLTRRAALYALEPRLLTLHLDASERAEWTRLVGAEAAPRPGVTTFGLGGAAGWGQAISRLIATGALVEDSTAQTWAPGAGLEDYFTDSWPQRAVFALQAAAKILASDSADMLSAEEEAGLTALAA